MNSYSNCLKIHTNKSVSTITKNPYLDHIIKRKSFSKSKSMISSNYTQNYLSTNEKFTNTQKSFIKITPEKEQFDDKRAKELEILLNERLEKFKSGSNEWQNEKEIYESIYNEITKHFACFGNLLKTIISKFENFIMVELDDKYKEKIQKINEKNKALVMKINQLNEINNELTKKIKVFENKEQEYVRIFEKNPNFLINYENIVDKMLAQITMITQLKKENRFLKKSKEKNLIDTLKTDKN